ncbi:signal peptidase I [Chlamydia pecorum]|uniref:signal peptidase I n=1 Tax=Chlamydia pecorum TaxID=85991 RepID=UPI0007AF7AF5|nr:signal peptidase I [Chlamydia pecorum]KZN27142.1 signal peptidase I [Chlamydia pecorum]
MKPYSLRKSRQILHQAFKLLKTHNFIKSPQRKQHLQSLLQQLEDAIFQKDSKTANELACQVQALCKEFPASFGRKLFEFTKAVCFAALVAFVVRQFWFELYEVPTGSMRPTILEQDRIIVSKTTFGLHFPFFKTPLGFSPEAITRGGLVVFTVEGLPIPDSDTLYFGFIPGKKRYVKRCIGKPGDTLYFYGGEIYGLDSEGDPIHLPKKPGPYCLYHVPYISFDGSTELSVSKTQSTTIFKQMNSPCGKITLPQEGTYNQFFHNGIWKNDIPNSLKDPHNSPVSYADIFGLGNYAMVRILTHKQALLAHSLPQEIPSAQAYLEICHTPNVSYPSPLLRRYQDNKFISTIQPMKTLLPLRSEHLHLIRKNLTTSRFVISQGFAQKYQPFAAAPSEKAYALHFPGIPDGCYEFFKGDVYRISFGGTRYKLKSTHPLAQLTDAQIIELFNCGVSFLSIFTPIHPQQAPLPNRYAFFNQGDLYIMGSPIFTKTDPALKKFIETEKAKQEASSPTQPYIAFIDRGPPPEDLPNFKEFIQNFGLKIPQGHILVLGDNYPMSADSREFGFVPVENLLGTPLWTFWPLNRIGKLTNVSSPISLPGYLVNGIALGIIVSSIGYFLYQRKRRLFPKNENPQNPRTP